MVLSAGVVAFAAIGTGHGLSATSAAAAAAAAPNPNCTLVVPANPLTAQGLATPYQLTATDPANGPCNEANANQTAFVQGAVIDPATGHISVYNPLIIDAGTQPAVAPVAPTLPAGGVVALWFGFNGTTLSFEGADQAGVTTAATTPTVTASPTAAITTPAASASASSGGTHHGHRHRHGTTAATAAPSVTASTAATTATTAAATTAAATTGSFTAPTITGTAPPANANVPAASGTPDAILQQSNCITGEDIAGTFSSFTQVGACNAVAFFQAANTAIGNGQLTVPNPGTATDGQPCLTTRNFGLIDQDQSDNVTTAYLANANGQTAMDTTANQQALAGAITLANGSDNRLLDLLVDPALGCTPWTVPDLANNGAMVPALPLNELQAAKFAGQSGGPAAMVPLNDPMTLDNNGNFSTDKANTYRSIVDQSPLPAGESPAEYCGDMESIQGVRTQQDVNLLIGQASPVPAMASNLFTFLAMRLQQSFVNLNCPNFGLQNDVSTTVNGAGVVVAACFLQQVNAVTAGAGNPTAGMTVCPATTTAAASATPSATPTAASTAGATPTPTPTPTSSGTVAAQPGGNAGKATRHHRHWWF